MTCPNCDQPALQMDHETWVARRFTRKFRVYCLMCGHDWWLTLTGRLVRRTH
jgi:hypothetical protein